MSASPLRKVVLITGVTANGLGASLALKLAQSSEYKVYGTLRSLSKADEFKREAVAKSVDPDAVTILEMEVTKPESCQAAIQKLTQLEGRLDILVNNAGAGFVQTIESASEQEVQNCFDVNFFGPYRMCKLAIPVMRENQFGRIINVGSIGSLVGQNFNEAYCAAKAATDSLAESLNGTVWKFGIKVTSFCPGAISSSFGSTAMQTMGSQTFPEPYKPLLDSYVKVVTRRRADPELAAKTQTPEQCADDIVRIIQAENPPVRFITESVNEMSACKLVPDGGDKVVNLLNARYYPDFF